MSACDPQSPWLRRSTRVLEQEGMAMSTRASLWLTSGLVLLHPPGDCLSPKLDKLLRTPQDSTPVLPPPGGGSGSRGAPLTCAARLFCGTVYNAPVIAHMYASLNKDLDNASVFSQPMNEIDLEQWK